MTRMTDQTTIGALIDKNIARGAPSGTDTFTYVDISSIDTRSKTIASPKSIAVAEAPSRARQHLRRDDVIVSMTRPNLNAVAMVTSEFDGAIGSTGLCILRPKDVLPKWLYYRVQAADFVVSMTEITQGVLYPAVKTKDIHDFPLVVPKLSAQHAIVEEIETQFARLDDAESALHRAEVRLEKLEESLIQDHVIRPTNHDNWSESTIADVKEFSLYGPRFSRDSYSDTGIPVLRTSDINSSGKVDLKRSPRINLTPDQIERYRLVRGDLLVTRTGSIGTLAVFDDSVTAIPGAYLIQYRLTKEAPLSKWIYYVLKSPYGQHALIGSSAGVGRPNVNAPSIDRISFRFPDKSTQGEIIENLEAALSKTEATRRTISADILQIKALRQAILKNAFEGNHGQ